MTDHIERLRDLLIRFNAEPPVDAADSFLAATFPPACQTCDGLGDGPEPGCNLCDSFGRSGCLTHAGVVGTACPDCPTIAQLLAWGVAVATLSVQHNVREGDRYAVNMPGVSSHVRHAIDLFHRLWAVKP